MLRYDNGTDWVEVNPAVARKPMRALVVLDGDSIEAAHRAAVALTLDAHFTDPETAAVVDWRGDVLGLTVQQWNWWKRMLWQAAREAKIDPEA